MIDLMRRGPYYQEDWDAIIREEKEEARKEYESEIGCIMQMRACTRGQAVAAYNEMYFDA